METGREGMGLLTLSRIWQFADYQKMKDTVATLTPHSENQRRTTAHNPFDRGRQKINKYTNEQSEELLLNYSPIIT